MEELISAGAETLRKAALNEDAKMSFMTEDL